MGFDNQIAIVTGGWRGIGKAVAMLFAKRDASVLIVGRTQSALETSVEEIGSVGNGRVAIVAGDIADPLTAILAIETAQKSLGDINILTNIAGIFPTALLEVTTGNMFDETISVNFTSTFRACCL
jgi:3-oxoacyl-[acyl-carrier protein] reductase